MSEKTNYFSLDQEESVGKSSVTQKAVTKGQKDTNQAVCAIKIVDGITEEIDCHCHSYQFWFVIFIVLYVANFVNTIFVLSKYYSAEKSSAAQWLYITYALMGLVIVIVYVLMEVETWHVHNLTLYIYSILLAALNYLVLKTLIQSQGEDSVKKLFFGCLAIGTTLMKFWIVFKLRFRAKNLIHLEQERRKVRSENNLQP